MTPKLASQKVVELQGKVFEKEHNLKISRHKRTIKKTQKEEN